LSRCGTALATTPSKRRPQSSCVARREIAAALVLTLGAVEKHVAGIFAKLGLPACQTDNRRVLAVLLYPGS
jgi:hypothetical protein